MIGGPLFFTFPENAHWNAEQQAIEFGVEIGEYRGVVRVPRRVFQRLLPERPTPERCVEAYYLQRTGTRGSPSGSCGGVVGRGRQSGDQRGDCAQGAAIARFEAGPSLASGSATHALLQDDIPRNLQSEHFVASLHANIKLSQLAV